MKRHHAEPLPNAVLTRVDLERGCVVMTTMIKGEPLAWIELSPNEGGLDELITLLIAGRDSIRTTYRPLTAIEQRTQAARCPCNGTDDMCKCQNEPDAETLMCRAMK